MSGFLLIWRSGWLWLGGILSLLGCSPPYTPLTDGNFTYRLSEPDQEYLLTDAIDEISGLSYQDASTLAAVDDEEDAIFMFDPEQGVIKKRIPFGDRDDYEGVERVGDVWYGLRSDGDLFEILRLGRPDQSVTKHETALSDDNDTEGLGYDPATRSLLIACKKGGRLPSQAGSERVMVYRYDPEAQQLTPFLRSTDRLFQELASGRQEFRVSAIARHPITGNYYLLSSADQCLLILDDQSQVQQVAPLHREQFSQPEGICFSPEGTLYISNEGRNGPATIYRFERAPGAGS